MEEPPRVTLDEERAGNDPLVYSRQASGMKSIERLLEARLTRIQDGGSEHDDGAERLLFSLDGERYSVALAELREALPAIPIVVTLPFSPPWLLGLFALRTDLITLIDPRPILAHGPDPLATNDRLARAAGEQALLMGATGRLVAFVVERIGDIVTGSGSGELASDDECARRNIMPRYVEEARYLDDGVSVEPVVALNLDTFYADVMSSLESWARHV